MELGLGSVGVLIEEVDGSPSGYATKLKFTNGGLTDNGDGSFIVDLTVGGVTDHGVLSGLSDDDHSQYGLLVGRAGGQILIGGIGSGDNLTLRSTSHATKGSIILDSRIKLSEEGSQDFYSYEGSKDDDESIDLPDSLAGFVFVTFDEGAEWALCNVTDAAVVTLITYSSNNVVDTNTDAKYCIFDNGTNVRIRNRIGSAKNIKIIAFMG